MEKDGKDSKLGTKKIVQAIKKGMPAKEIATKFDVSEREITKLSVIDAVKNGMSFRQASKKFDIYISTVDFWCRNAGVKSEFAKQIMKATDNDILKAVKKNKVMTVQMLEKVFGYQTNTARKRLKRLAQDGKLEYIVLGGGGKAAPLFKDYTARRIYYTTKEDLHKWLKSKFLTKMPRALKVAITHKLHRDSGIDLKFEEPKKKALMLNTNIYDKIKQKAIKKGISPAEYVEKVA